MLVGERIMSVGYVSELSGDYEIVILPDGTQIRRERQTKAQARMKALQAKNRNKKLRQKLILLADEVDVSSEIKILEERKQEDQTAINHQIKANKNDLHLNDKPLAAYSIDTDCVVESSSQVTTADESTAIQRQMDVITEKTTRRHELSGSNKDYQTKESAFKVLGLNTLSFGELINKKIVQFLTKQKLNQRV